MQTQKLVPVDSVLWDPFKTSGDSKPARSRSPRLKATRYSTTPVALWHMASAAMRALKSLETEH